MPETATCRQTQSFLMERFAQARISPRTQLGQNFLVDLNLVRLLVQAAGLGPRDVVLEVGTGTGSLTALMAAQSAAVVTVEVDRELFHLAAEHLRPLANVRMMQLDALKNKSHLNPEVLEAIDRELSAAPDRQWKLAANLPYHVATPILTNCLDLDRPPRSMTVTIQKELADRIQAVPRTKDYGALSIWVQSQCRIELVRTMPPSVFWPRPKVTSAILHITLDDELRRRIPDRAFFHQFVRAMFFHRRKFLRSELIAATKDRLDKPQVDQLMAGLGLGGNARAEELDVPAMLALCEAVRTSAAR
jgi:16S rRNA (adenine1518-N6/adenine1519-N6)-dimethyltransferase